MENGEKKPALMANHQYQTGTSLSMKREGAKRNGIDDEISASCFNFSLIADCVKMRIQLVFRCHRERFFNSEKVLYYWQIADILVYVSSYTDA